MTFVTRFALNAPMSPGFSRIEHLCTPFYCIDCVIRQSIRGMRNAERPKIQGNMIVPSVFIRW